MSFPTRLELEAYLLIGLTNRRHQKDLLDWLKRQVIHTVAQVNRQADSVLNALDNHFIWPLVCINIAGRLMLGFNVNIFST